MLGSTPFCASVDGKFEYDATVASGSEAPTHIVPLYPHRTSGKKIISRTGYIFKSTNSFKYTDAFNLINKTFTFDNIFCCRVVHLVLCHIWFQHFIKHVNFALNKHYIDYYEGRYDTFIIK